MNEEETKSILEKDGRVADILTYPIKGFHGQRVDYVEIGSHGRLAVPVLGNPVHDRELVLTMEEERCSKKYDSTKCSEFKQIRTNYDFQDSTVTLQDRQGELSTATFDLEPRNRDLEDWVSKKLGQDAYLNKNSGIEDQLYVPGPSMIAKSTLEEMASWFEDESAETMALRLRPNIIVGDVPVFWDDLLYPDTEDGEPVSIQVGDATLRGEEPCERCNIPSMDPYTGDEDREFAATYIQNRENTYPEFTENPLDNPYTGMSLTMVEKSQIGSDMKQGDTVSIN